MERIVSKELRVKYIKEYHLQSIIKTPLSDISELQKFKKNEVMIQADRPSRYLYFLVRGETIVTFTSNNQTVCISYMTPLAWLGEAASLWNTAPNCTVRALNTCICIAIDLTVHRTALLQDILFMQNTCQLLSCKLNDCDFSPRTLLAPLGMRLSKFILRYSNQDIFSFRLTNCALILNTSYRHLLRMLKKFCDEGILCKNRNGYLIKNRALLQQYSEEYSPEKEDE